MFAFSNLSYSQVNIFYLTLHLLEQIGLTSEEIEHSTLLLYSVKTFTNTSNKFYFFSILLECERQLYFLKHIVIENALQFNINVYMYISV